MLTLTLTEGVLSRGDIVQGDIVQGGYCPGDIVQGDVVRGDVVRGDIVLIPCDGTYRGNLGCNSPNLAKPEIEHTFQLYNRLDIMLLNFGTCA